MAEPNPTPPTPPGPAVPVPPGRPAPVRPEPPAPASSDRASDRASGRHRGPADDLPLVRPYARSNATSHVSHELALESLVSTTEAGRRLSRLLREPYGSACELCVSTVSVAELSAYLGLSLGSARELVEVLVAEQLLHVHPTVGEYAAPERALVLDRVLDELGDL